MNLPLIRSRTRGLARVNRFLSIGILALGLLILLDFIGGKGGAAVALTPIRPPLEEALGPFPGIPPLELSAALFGQTEPAAPGPPSAAPAAAGLSFKLKGVVAGRQKKALLEDPEGRQVWVTEGEPIGASRVKEIRDRVILLEREGTDYEIRM